MKPIIKQAIGVLAGPIVMTITSIFNILQITELSCFVYIIGFFLLGRFIARTYSNAGFRWVNYWTLFILFFLNLFPSFSFEGGLNFGPFEYLIGPIIIISYLLGLLNTSLWYALAMLASTVVVVFLVILPIYDKVVYRMYQMQDSQLIGREINLSKIHFLDADSLPSKGIRLDSTKPSLVILTFVHCKPCKEQKKFISKNIDKIKKKYNVITIYPEYLSTFQYFVKESQKYPEIPAYYDRANESVHTIDSTMNSYPNEFRLDLNNHVTDHFKGFSRDAGSTYLKELLENE